MGGGGGNGNSNMPPSQMIGYAGPTLGQHQTMFFGPAHTFTQYSSLPRRSAGVGAGAAAAAAGAAFQRNTPIRRSTGIPEHHMEYFVPRSISEFNLSGVGDLALPPPRRYSPTVQHTGVGAGGNGMGGLSGVLPHGLQLICTGQPPLPATQAQQAQPTMQLVMKPRGEKMVTFEDESKVMNVVAASSAGVVTTSNASTATHCPHRIPATPRKAGAAGGGADLYM